VKAVTISEAALVAIALILLVGLIHTW